MTVILFFAGILFGAAIWSVPAMIIALFTKGGKNGH